MKCSRFRISQEVMAAGDGDEEVIGEEEEAGADLCRGCRG